MPSLKAKIKVTHYCENNCWYCFVKKEKRHITSEMLEKIVMKLRKMYDTGKYSRVKISITGGDPFYTDRSLEAADLVTKTFKDADLFYFGEVCVTANLDRVKQFSKMGGGLLFSLNEDDPEEVARRQREVGGQGTFNVLFTKKNVERMDEIIEVIKKYKLRVRCNHIYDPENKYNLIPYIEEGAKKLLTALKDMNYVFPYSISTFGNMNYQNKSNTYCGYGETYFNFDIYGNVSRCHMEDPITTVYDENLEETIQIKHEVLEKCNSCDFKSLCKGGCYYTNKYGKFCEQYYKIASLLSPCLIDKERNEND